MNPDRPVSPVRLSPGRARAALPMPTRMRTAFGLACVLAGLAGCATPASHQAMTVQPSAVPTVNAKLKSAVKVGTVSGGESTNPIWTSEVDNTAFKQALESSLAIAGYGAPAGADGTYTLSAELQKLEQPLIGLSFDVKSTVLYTLTGPNTDRKYPVTFTGTAGVSDAFIGTVRLRIANERSIAGNIKELLRQLGDF